MTPEEAARSLDDRFHDEPWYVTVGVGKESSRNVIYVYAKKRSKAARELEHGWMGFPALIRVSGTFVPLPLRRAAM